MFFTYGDSAMSTVFRASLAVRTEFPALQGESDHFGLWFFFTMFPVWNGEDSGVLVL
jgi:hypothetical protein